MNRPSWIPGAHVMFHVYKAKDGFGWRLWARNGNLIAESGETYKRKHTARRMAYRLQVLGEQTSAVVS